MLLMIRRLFLLLVRPTFTRLGVLPTSADTVAAAAVLLAAAGGVWTWGAWTQIVAAVGVTADTLVTGLTLENFVGGPSQGEVGIAIGAGGFEVELARVPAASGYYTFPSALLVGTNTRVSARYRTSTGIADTVDVKLLTAAGI